MQPYRFHKHEGEQEAYYILKGEALYSDNGNEIIIKSRRFHLCVKVGEGHSIKNTGNEDLELYRLNYEGFKWYNGKWGRKSNNEKS